MFYRVIQKPTASALRLSPINPDKRYHAKWSIVGQSPDHVAIRIDVPFDTLGFFVKESEMKFRDSEPISSVLLLVNDQLLHFPKQCVKIVSKEELNKAQKDE